MSLQDVHLKEAELEKTSKFITSCNCQFWKVADFCLEHFAAGDYYIEFPAGENRKIYFRYEEDKNYFAAFF